MSSTVETPAWFARRVLVLWEREVPAVDQATAYDMALMEATTTANRPESERSTLSHYHDCSIGKEDSAAGRAFALGVVSFGECRESGQWCDS